jgi:hypothetical protein
MFKKKIFGFFVNSAESTDSNLLPKSKSNDSSDNEGAFRTSLETAKKLSTLPDVLTAPIQDKKQDPFKLLKTMQKYYIQKLKGTTIEDKEQIAAAQAMVLEIKDDRLSIYWDSKKLAETIKNQEKQEKLAPIIKRCCENFILYIKDQYTAKVDKDSRNVITYSDAGWQQKNYYSIALNDMDFNKIAEIVAKFDDSIKLEPQKNQPPQ